MARNMEQNGPKWSWSKWVGAYAPRISDEEARLSWKWLLAAHDIPKQDFLKEFERDDNPDECPRAEVRMRRKTGRFGARNHPASFELRDVAHQIAAIRSGWAVATRGEIARTYFVDAR